MDHVHWYESSALDPIKVPFICRDGPLCGSHEFLDFPQRHGWKLDQSESLAQLAERAQAWLFFGLLAITRVSPDACVDLSTGEPLVTMKWSLRPWRLQGHEGDTLPQLMPALCKAESVMLGEVIPLLRNYEALEALDLWNSRAYAVLFSIDVLLDTIKAQMAGRKSSTFTPHDIFIWPSISDKSSILEQSVTEQTSIPEQNVFERSSLSENSTIPGQSSIFEQSTLPEQSSLSGDSSIAEASAIAKQSNAEERLKPSDTSTVSTALPDLRSGSFFPKLTRGVAQSLLHAGRCGSLAHRLEFTSSQFYHLMSLPRSDESSKEDHSRCSETSCSCFNVDQTTYQTRHTKDCVMCDGVGVAESKLVDLIQRNEVPVIRSTIDSNGRVTISVEKMDKGVDYAAISHVWAGGLGNFEENQLPHCQLLAIHQDVCNTMVSAFGDNFEDDDDAWDYWGRDMLKRKYCSVLRSQSQEPGRSAWLSSCAASTTCHYWMDTLCVPNNHPGERQQAINSMGRVYAGAAAVLVLDPALSGIEYKSLSGWEAKMLVEVSPWMARSWPLQEAALAPYLYVKFSDASTRFEHKHVGMAATLQSIPNQDLDSRQLTWSGSLKEEFQTGDPLPYTPNTEFIRVWNLLAKRTTSYPEDIPAIFATLLYRAAGEVLSIHSARRTWALLQSVDSLPLDILCVEQQAQLDQTSQELWTRQWMPRLPGSSKPVPTLDTKYGLLQRVASGFVLQLCQTKTRALICPRGLPASGGLFLLREVHTMQSFLVHLREPNGQDTTSKANAGHDSAEESQLILMLPKEQPGSLSANCGILCKIKGHSGDTMRVEILSNKITWRCHSAEQLLPARETRDCVSADAYCTVMIDMSESMR